MSNRKSDNEVNEAFAKAIGLLFVKGLPALMEKDYWYDPEDFEDRATGEQKIYHDLPNWCQDFPAFKRDVIGRMGEAGYKFGIINDYFRWFLAWPGTGVLRYAKIKDNEILRAGVESATEHFERRKG